MFLREYMRRHVSYFEVNFLLGDSDPLIQIYTNYVSNVLDILGGYMSNHDKDATRWGLSSIYMVNHFNRSWHLIPW